MIKNTMVQHVAQHLILTHEQADFDALAALLGAHLLDERSVPVLPRRMNRNCRAFLSLYGDELPFVESNDLPPEAVAAVTLVDTQSLITLKGVSSKTRVQVIDHHSLRPDLPSEWQVRIEPTGSTTALFVEGLRERDNLLLPLHATLLLLGIYEDTGSLMYASTTARDASAVSFLLEQGASLELAARFLNPPLSPDQRAVCDRLLADAQTLSVHGQTIVVAAADAQDTSDEISSIAHKIRDLLDPAALFILVRTVEGIRLVARSTTDQVDVSNVASYFGGGGHGRAAAALLRLPSLLAPEPDPLRGARAELIARLPEYIQPSTSVRQVMSRHPRILSPDTSLEEAAHLMRRYGYEGFPVVEDGRVLGLLTRRAVDRALSHHLNLTVKSLMDAGEVSVKMEDSIDHLREVMANSGWGQIPVIDAEGRLAGIVTRTDLLKHLAALPGASRRVNLSPKLTAALPAARLALLRTVASEARALHSAVYIVGGYVRDLILDRPGVDFDIVVEGDAIALAHALQRRYGGRILAHKRFGTAKWDLSTIRTDLAAALAAQPAPAGSNGPPACDPSDLPEALDLISARTEFYDYPTALPTVERSSIKLDLHRRDFTINTLALRLDGRHFGDLYDYWGGLRDLHKGIVRVLHSLSFVDDPTRQLRAVRFEQRFNFHIDERTLQLMREGRPLIHRLSGDRLRHEMNLIFQEPNALAILKRLGHLDLLAAIHPAVPDPSADAALAARLEKALFSAPPPYWDLPEKTASLSLSLALAYLVWLIPLEPPAASQAALRLRLPGALVAMLAGAGDLWRSLPALDSQDTPSSITARLDALPRPALYAVALSLADGHPAAGLLDSYVRNWRHIYPRTTGDDLRQRGLPPGPHFKTILSRLRAAWLDGEITDPVGEVNLLEQILSQLDFSQTSERLPSESP